MKNSASSASSCSEEDRLSFTRVEARDVRSVSLVQSRCASRAASPLQASIALCSSVVDEDFALTKSREHTAGMESGQKETETETSLNGEGTQQVPLPPSPPCSLPFPPGPVETYTVQTDSHPALPSREQKEKNQEPRHSFQKGPGSLHSSLPPSPGSTSRDPTVDVRTENSGSRRTAPCVAEKASTGVLQPSTREENLHVPSANSSVQKEGLLLHEGVRRIPVKSEGAALAVSPSADAVADGEGEGVKEFEKGTSTAAELDGTGSEKGNSDSAKQQPFASPSEEHETKTLRHQSSVQSLEIPPGLQATNTGGGHRSGPQGGGGGALSGGMFPPLWNARGGEEAAESGGGRGARIVPRRRQPLDLALGPPSRGDTPLGTSPVLRGGWTGGHIKAGGEEGGGVSRRVSSVGTKHSLPPPMSLAPAALSSSSLSPSASVPSLGMGGCRRGVALERERERSSASFSNQLESGRAEGRGVGTSRADLSGTSISPPGGRLDSSAPPLSRRPRLPPDSLPVSSIEGIRGRSQSVSSSLSLSGVGVLCLRDPPPSMPAENERAPPPLERERRPQEAIPRKGKGTQTSSLSSSVSASFPARDSEKREVPGGGEKAELTGQEGEKCQAGTRRAALPASISNEGLSTETGDVCVQAASLQVGDAHPPPPPSPLPVEGRVVRRDLAAGSGRSSLLTSGAPRSVSSDLPLPSGQKEKEHHERAEVNAKAIVQSGVEIEINIHSSLSVGPSLSRPELNRSCSSSVSPCAPSSFGFVPRLRQRRGVKGGEGDRTEISLIDSRDSLHADLRLSRSSLLSSNLTAKGKILGEVFPMPHPHLSIALPDEGMGIGIGSRKSTAETSTVTVPVVPRREGGVQWEEGNSLSRGAVRQQPVFSSSALAPSFQFPSASQSLQKEPSGVSPSPSAALHGQQLWAAPQRELRLSAEVTPPQEGDNMRSIVPLSTKSCNVSSLTPTPLRTPPRPSHRSLSTVSSVSVCFGARPPACAHPSLLHALTKETQLQTRVMKLKSDRRNRTPIEHGGGGGGGGSSAGPAKPFASLYSSSPVGRGFGQVGDESSDPSFSGVAAARVQREEADGVGACGETQNRGDSALLGPLLPRIASTPLLRNLSELLLDRGIGAKTSVPLPMHAGEGSLSSTSPACLGGMQANSGASGQKESNGGGAFDAGAAIDRISRMLRDTPCTNRSPAPSRTVPLKLEHPTGHEYNREASTAAEGMSGIAGVASPPLSLRGAGKGNCNVQPGHSFPFSSSRLRAEALYRRLSLLEREREALLSELFECPREDLEALFIDPLKEKEAEEEGAMEGDSEVDRVRGEDADGNSDNKELRGGVCEMADSLSGRVEDLQCDSPSSSPLPSDSGMSPFQTVGGAWKEEEEKGGQEENALRGKGKSSLHFPLPSFPDTVARSRVSLTDGIAFRRGAEAPPIIIQSPRHPAELKSSLSTKEGRRGTAPSPHPFESSETPSISPQTLHRDPQGDARMFFSSPPQSPSSSLSVSLGMFREEERQADTSPSLPFPSREHRVAERKKEDGGRVERVQGGRDLSPDFHAGKGEGCQRDREETSMQERGGGKEVAGRKEKDMGASVRSSPPLRTQKARRGRGRGGSVRSSCSRGGRLVSASLSAGSPVATSVCAEEEEDERRSERSRVEGGNIGRVAFQENAFWLVSTCAELNLPVPPCLSHFQKKMLELERREGGASGSSEGTLRRGLLESLPSPRELLSDLCDGVLLSRLQETACGGRRALGLNPCPRRARTCWQNVGRLMEALRETGLVPQNSSHGAASGRSSARKGAERSDTSSVSVPVQGEGSGWRWSDSSVQSLWEFAFTCRGKGEGFFGGGVQRKFEVQARGGSFSSSAVSRSLPSVLSAEENKKLKEGASALLVLLVRMQHRAAPLSVQPGPGGALGLGGNARGRSGNSGKGSQRSTGMRSEQEDGKCSATLGQADTPFFPAPLGGGSDLDLEEEGMEAGVSPPSSPSHPFRKSLREARRASDNLAEKGQGLPCGGCVQVRGGILEDLGKCGQEEGAREGDRVMLREKLEMRKSVQNDLLKGNGVVREEHEDAQKDPNQNQSVSPSRPPFQQPRSVLSLWAPAASSLPPHLSSLHNKGPLGALAGNRSDTVFARHQGEPAGEVSRPLSPPVSPSGSRGNLHPQTKQRQREIGDPTPVCPSPSFPSPHRSPNLRGCVPQDSFQEENTEKERGKETEEEGDAAAPTREFPSTPPRAREEKTTPSCSFSSAHVFQNPTTTASAHKKNPSPFKRLTPMPDPSPSSPSPSSTLPFSFPFRLRQSTSGLARHPSPSPSSFPDPKAESREAAGGAEEIPERVSLQYPEGDRQDSRMTSGVLRGNRWIRPAAADEQQRKSSQKEGGGGERDRRIIAEHGRPEVFRGGEEIQQTDGVSQIDCPSAGSAPLCRPMTGTPSRIMVSTGTLPTPGQCHGPEKQHSTQNSQQVTTRTTATPPRGPLNINSMRGRGALPGGHAASASSPEVRSLYSWIVKFGGERGACLSSEDLLSSPCLVLADGVLLCEIAQRVGRRPLSLSERVERKEPVKKPAALANINKALRHFRQDASLSPSFLFDDEALLRGEPGAVLGLLSDLHTRYRGAGGGGSHGQKREMAGVSQALTGGGGRTKVAPVVRVEGDRSVVPSSSSSVCSKVVSLQSGEENKEGEEEKPPVVEGQCRSSRGGGADGPPTSGVVSPPSAIPIGVSPSAAASFVSTSAASALQADRGGAPPAGKQLSSSAPSLSVSAVSSFTPTPGPPRTLTSLSSENGKAGIHQGVAAPVEKTTPSSWFPHGVCPQGAANPFASNAAFLLPEEEAGSLLFSQPHGGMEAAAYRGEGLLACRGNLRVPSRPSSARAAAAAESEGHSQSQSHSPRSTRKKETNLQVEGGSSSPPSISSQFPKRVGGGMVERGIGVVREEEGQISFSPELATEKSPQQLQEDVEEKERLEFECQRQRAWSQGETLPNEDTCVEREGNPASPPHAYSADPTPKPPGFFALASLWAPGDASAPSSASKQVQRGREGNGFGDLNEKEGREILGRHGTGSGAGGIPEVKSEKQKQVLSFSPPRKQKPQNEFLQEPAPSKKGTVQEAGREREEDKGKQGLTEFRTSGHKPAPHSTVQTKNVPPSSNAPTTAHSIPVGAIRPGSKPGPSLRQGPPTPKRSSLSLSLSLSANPRRLPPVSPKQTSMEKLNQGGGLDCPASTSKRASRSQQPAKRGGGHFKQQASSQAARSSAPPQNSSTPAGAHSGWSSYSRLAESRGSMGGRGGGSTMIKRGDRDRTVSGEESVGNGGKGPMKEETTGIGPPRPKASEAERESVYVDGGDHRQGLTHAAPDSRIAPSVPLWGSAESETGSDSEGIQIEIVAAAAVAGGKAEEDSTETLDAKSQTGNVSTQESSANFEETECHPEVGEGVVIACPPPPPLRVPVSFFRPSDENQVSSSADERDLRKVSDDASDEAAVLFVPPPESDSPLFQTPREGPEEEEGGNEPHRIAMNKVTPGAVSQIENGEQGFFEGGRGDGSYPCSASSINGIGNPAEDEKAADDYSDLQQQQLLGESAEPSTAAFSSDTAQETSREESEDEKGFHDQPEPSQNQSEESESRPVSGSGGLRRSARFCAFPFNALLSPASSLSPVTVYRFSQPPNTCGSSTGGSGGRSPVTASPLIPCQTHTSTAGSMHGDGAVSGPGFEPESGAKGAAATVGERKEGSSSVEYLKENGVAVDSAEKTAAQLHSGTGHSFFGPPLPPSLLRLNTPGSPFREAVSEAFESEEAT